MFLIKGDHKKSGTSGPDFLFFLDFSMKESLEVHGR